MSSYTRALRWIILLALATGLSPAAAHVASDPPAWVLTSESSLRNSPLRHLPALDRRDSLGTALKLLQLDPAQQHLLTDHVHHHEGRCGGYFAFESRAHAEDFLARERALQSLLGRANADYTIDNAATVEPWLPQVTEANIRATIEHLSSYQNRYYSSPHGLDAALWIHDHWAALAAGRSDVQMELFTDCALCSTQPSVILTVTGSELPDEVVVVGAHLDSIRSGAGSNPQQFAPGADDDASGIAVISEVIRIAMASGWQPQRSVKFMGYAAEEVGLRGSRAIAERFAADNVNVVGVLQLDMTNYHDAVPYHLHFISDYSNGPLLAFSRELFDVYLGSRGLQRRDLACGYGCSDHASWTATGFPAVMASEPGSTTYDFFPGLHTANDTLDQVGGTAQASVTFAWFGLAFIGELAKTAPATDLPALHVDGFESQD